MIEVSKASMAKFSAKRESVLAQVKLMQDSLAKANKAIRETKELVEKELEELKLALEELEEIRDGINDKITEELSELKAEVRHSDHGRKIRRWANSWGKSVDIYVDFNAPEEIEITGLEDLDHLQDMTSSPVE